MKYNQPFDQPLNPDAPYINGDPRVGRMGSIPPAESIEFPQRELVALIQATAQPPSNGDLSQVLKAIKLIDTHNTMKIGTNTGNASQWSMTCTGAIPFGSIPVGTSVWFKPGMPSVNGGTVFSLNGTAFRPVVNLDLSPVGIGDILPTAWLRLFYDGSYWQIIAGSTRLVGTLPLLHAAANWYVNGTLGDDNIFDGTTASSIGGGHGPFRTLQRAANEVIKYNMNGYDQFVWVADGTYAAVTLEPTNGSGWVWFIGNEANPQNCAVLSSSVGIHPFFQRDGTYRIRGFKLSGTGMNASNFATNGGKTRITNMRFGPCWEFHIGASWSSTLTLDLGGTITIEAGANARAHMGASGGAQIIYESTPPYNALNVLGDVTFSAGFALAWQLAAVQMIYSSITGGAFVHGPQYNGMGLGIINSLGVGSFPGNPGPGILSYGAQYIP